MDLEWSLDIAMLSIHHKTYFLETTICLRTPVLEKKKGLARVIAGRRMTSTPRVKIFILELLLSTDTHKCMIIYISVNL